jgi:hypothetical protein
VNRKFSLSAGLCAVAAAATLALVGPGTAVGHRQGPVPAPPTNPTRADQIQNIDQVRTAIKGYYGDTVTDQVDPVPNNVDGADVVLHTFDQDGSYAHEVAGIERRASWYLAHRAHRHHFDGKPALIFDIDDTTLNTFNYEIYSNFAYNPTTNGYFVNAAVFPAVPGMPELVSRAAAQGYEVFFLTGRPETQRAGTATNLTNAGYGTPAADHVFLKDQTLPWLSSCTPGCTSAQYKALTRQHLIEDLGFDIVANFGDQPSDFTGGFEDTTVKLPNPMYYLP